MAVKKTIAEIKEMFPNLRHKVDAEGLHSVGYKNRADSIARKGSYNIQGTGNTEAEAFQEAYEWLTRTGRYDVEKDFHYHQKSEG